MPKVLWPSWRYGPGGKSQVFESAEEVPAGWEDHPSKVKGAAAAPAGDPPTKTEAPTGDGSEIDAHGHPWSEDLHAGTKAKTNQGLWRMKVGKSRPDPLPGFPKPPALDL